jgi:hypothetical protein
MDYPQVDPPMDAPDAPVRRILERAARITGEEAAALDEAIRTGAPHDSEAQAVLDEHQSWKNHWAMFDHWPDPYIEMGWARDRVRGALGLPRRPGRALEPDDGTVAWGAGTAAAYAVLAAGRAGAPAKFQAAWDTVVEKSTPEAT